jgi:Fe-S oxidoreductase
MVKNDKAKNDRGAPDASALRAMLREFDSARGRMWLDICSGCGLCAESCFYYLSGDRDPKLSPAYKARSTFGEMVKKKGNVTRAFLDECYETAWFKCTGCKRCSQFCPFGIDIASMMFFVRSLCHSQGIPESGLTVLAENHRETGNHSGISKEEFIDTCQWIEEETRDEIRGAELPIDKENAHYVYTLNPREIVFQPQEVGLAAKILTLAGESWTLPSRGWDCTNLPMFMGDRKLAGETVREVYDAARRLNAKKILLTECGHAYRSLALEGPYLAGYPDGKPPVEIVHSVQLFYEYLKDGRIEIDPAKRFKEPVTYQDPCGISRNGGLWKTARKIIPYLADDFREMSPCKDYNHCCGGGAGLIPMGAAHKAKRMASGRFKAGQIKKTGAKIVITSCHNCFDQVSDLGEEYGLGVKTFLFKEALDHMLVIPDALKPRLEDLSETGAA